MKIGELSSATGASPRSLRYYESLGLISSRRQPNGYREYDSSAAETVGTIKSLLDLGFPTSLIERVLPCTAGAGPIEGDCAAISERVAQIRDEMDAKAQRLLQTRDLLSDYLRETSSGGPTQIHATRADLQRRTRRPMPQKGE
ncbi:MerR family transcriptional regulator [Humibacter albus]|uniref:MerR family transcriptional regulator n=1 Tax=Humibacter albus TaxID=427754 RepID=UPI00040368CB|nr:MerR family transcriptional regulator [Humibacter albus]